MLHEHLHRFDVGREVGGGELAEADLGVLAHPEPVDRGPEGLDRLVGLGVAGDLHAGHPPLAEGAELGGDQHVEQTAC